MSPERVIVAPDKFKGSLTAPQVAAHVAAGLRQARGRGAGARPDVLVTTMPVADGGDGTVDAVVESGFARFQASVTGPIGDRVAASFAMRDTYATPALPGGPTKIETAVVELAEASGLRHLPAGPTPETALAATSAGTGELIRAAVERGARRVVLGLGGSACTDGGAGMLTALGVRLLDEDGRPLPPGGDALRRLARIDAAGLAGGLARGLTRVPVTVASDVDNPLLGPRGAANVYGPQKGARPGEIDRLEEGLARLAAVAWRDLGVDAADRPGAGAAGGVGYAALAFLEAEVRPGIDMILDLLSFDEKVEGSRLVITGEGSLDRQTLHGKAPAGVARAAARANVPVVAVAGRCSLTEEQLRGAGIAAAYALTDIEPDAEVSMAKAGPLLERLAADIAGAHLGGGRV